MAYKTPGVYVEEITTLAPSVARQPMRASVSSTLSKSGRSGGESPPVAPKGEPVPDAIPALREAGSGRPTKKERRRTDRLIGED